MSAEDVKAASDKHSNNSINQAPQVEFEESEEKRPSIQYSSVGAFTKSFASRLRSIFTKRFVFALLAGQLVSLCIAGTSIATTELVNHNWALPTTQTIFLYFSLFIIYTPYTIYQYGFGGWAKMIAKDGWKYIILAACDVEGNFMVVKAYQYTDLLSCMLLDAWATPCCMLFAWFYMRPKYRWTQILGVLICIAGLGLLVASDQITDKDYEPTNRGKGDGFMIAGATLYGFTNATEEFLVRRRPFYEVVGQLGMWGFIINGIQAAGLEHVDMTLATWNGHNVGVLIAYTIALFILYTFAPLIYRSASSTYYNMSLLSSDFFGLIFGLGVYHYHPYWLYFIAFAVVIVGLVTYFWQSTPEEQGELDPQKPDYIKERRVNTEAV